MDINRSNLEQNLIPMLNALADSHFVSFDLEFSGFSQGGAAKAKSYARGFKTKQTLQERYKGVKEAAEKYQVLQVGFTIVLEDKQQQLYHMRPYNMFLNPVVVDDKIGIDREFSFQGKAMKFLVDKGFSMDRVFKEGVPYMSKDEEKTAMQTGKELLDGAQIPDINLDIHEDELKLFAESIRQRINDWYAKEHHPERLEITAGAETFRNLMPNFGLSNIQKRLVHQIVEKEFPQLITVAAGPSILVLERNSERDRSMRALKMKQFMSKLQTQKGIGWFVEGLVRNDIDPPAPLNWFHSRDGKAIWVDTEQSAHDFQVLRFTLSQQSTVLVGHNLFVDLVYFYKTFFGTLPETVEQFVEIIHGLFPRIIDTKYLATHSSGEAVANRSSLADLDAEFGSLEKPLINVDLEHTKYNIGNHAHEAGYDSFITARLLVRLSALINSMSSSIETDGKSGGNRSLSRANVSLIDKVYASLDMTLLDEQANDKAIRDWIMKSPSMTLRPTSNGPECQTFDHLNFMPPQDQNDQLDAQSEDLITFSPKTPQLISVEPHEEMSHNEAISDLQSTGIQKGSTALMPSFESEFWKVYGNTLRVFGTEEGMVYLGDFSSGR